MKLKSYFSGTVEAAIELARKELGPEALLVNAKPAPPEARYLGAYEVVFGVVPETAGVSAAPKNEDPVRAELAELRRRLDRLTAPAPSPVAVPAVPLNVDPTLGVAEAPCSVVALVGPPGAGKTTTLIKLAARYGLARRKPTYILTTDVFRIGAADQLRTLAAILGIACEVAETPLLLERLLEEHDSKGLILIDTPGCSFPEMEEASELASFLAQHPGIDTHLVLPASMNSMDLRRVADAYAVFRPSKLLFTRLDEASSLSAIAAEAAHRNLPVSFLSTGQSIPDDLEEATLERLGVAPRRMGAAA